MYRRQKDVFFAYLRDEQRNWEKDVNAKECLGIYVYIYIYIHIVTEPKRVEPLYIVCLAELVNDHFGELVRFVILIYNLGVKFLANYNL